MADKIEINIEKKDDYKRIRRLEAYARFMEILDKKGLTPYNVGKNTDISTATLSDWKSGKSMPKNDKMEKIADYLDVDKDYILTGEEKPDPMRVGKEHAELLKMYEMLTSDEKEQTLTTMKLFLKNK